MSQIRSIIIHNDVHFLIWHIFCLKKVATATYEKKFKSPTKETSIIIDFNEYLMKGIIFQLRFLSKFYAELRFRILGIYLSTLQVLQRYI